MTHQLEDQELGAAAFGFEIKKEYIVSGRRRTFSKDDARTVKWKMDESADDKRADYTTSRELTLTTGQRTEYTTIDKINKSNLPYFEAMRTYFIIRLFANDF